MSDSGAQSDLLQHAGPSGDEIEVLVSIGCSICDESSGGMKLIGFAPHRQGCVSSLLFVKFLVKLEKKRRQFLPE